MITAGFIVCGIVCISLFALSYFLWIALKGVLVENNEKDRIVESQRKEIKHLSSVCGDRLNEMTKYKEMVGKERDEYTAICRKNAELNEEIKKGSELVSQLSIEADKWRRKYDDILGQLHETSELRDKFEKLWEQSEINLDASRSFAQMKVEEVGKLINERRAMLEQNDSQNEAIQMLKRELKEKEGKLLTYLNTLIGIDDLIHENVRESELQRL